jgi:hypothetical protein
VQECPILFVSKVQKVEKVDGADENNLDLIKLEFFME